MNITLKMRFVSSSARLLRYVFLFILLTEIIPCYAQVTPTNLTGIQQMKLDQFVLNYISEMRMEKPQVQPAFVNKFNKEYAEFSLQRAEADLKKYGHWFYCVGANGYPDEVVSYRVYSQLVLYYGGLGHIPGYSSKNHREAIDFWQSWQKKDGSFINPVFPGKNCNGKYIPAVLEILKSKPLYKTSGYGAVKIDLTYFISQCDSNHLNHAMARAAVIFTRIHEGKTEYIPTLERGIELALSHMCPQTGMFLGNNCDLPNGIDWSDYGATVETMKGLARMLGYMGVENIPYRHLRADNLIKNQDYFREGPISVIRNTAEMYMHCLFESSYRQEELLQAMQGNAKALFSTANWKTPHERAGGDYIAYAITIFGPYLNWKGFEDMAPRTKFYQGAAHDWKVVIGPFGRCANLIRKSPEALIWEKNWNYDKYGLRTLNVYHELKEVVDIIPASADNWYQFRDEGGRIVLKRKFTLGESIPVNPYLKIKWDGGDIEIFINGKFVRKKLDKMENYGAVYISPETRNSLHPGENTLMIRTVSATKNVLNVSAGLIDWSLPAGIND